MDTVLSATAHATHRMITINSPLCRGILCDAVIRPHQHDAGSASISKASFCNLSQNWFFGVVTVLTRIVSSFTASHEANPSVSSLVSWGSGLPSMLAQLKSASSFRLSAGSSCSASSHTLGHSQSEKPHRAGCCLSTCPSCPLVSDGLRTSLAL